MPATLSYPGVYIDELPSSVHTITGVATSIAAFVGWAPKGPTTKAVLVQSFSDYQRQFGGLDSRSYLGYAVNQFFGNGGQQAYIVRIAGPDAHVAKATLGGATVWATGPGAWATGFQLVVTIPSGSTTTFNLQSRTRGRHPRQHWRRT
jgi:phage tail sheath protein FI